MSLDLKKSITKSHFSDIYLRIFNKRMSMEAVRKYKRLTAPLIRQTVMMLRLK